VRIAGLLSSARRARALAVGTDASLGALAAAEVGGPGGARRAASLLVVACDAGSIASSAEVERAARAGQAIAWATKNDLGALLGEQAVAICAVLHAAIAAEVKRVRAAADAGAELTKGRQAAFAGARPGNRGAECSRRPEAR
jgi:ribosomal protein L7Ae-like RNA K-turn-binding protein